jgi:hypothetical protein
MSGSSAGYKPACRDLPGLQRGISGVFGNRKGFGGSFKRLPDPFRAKCPVCGHEAEYQKAELRPLFSVG